jgi:single-stranded DNA-specific DHH superfamily exonuclease
MILLKTTKRLPISLSAFFLLSYLIKLTQYFIHSHEWHASASELSFFFEKSDEISSIINIQYSMKYEYEEKHKNNVESTVIECNLEDKEQKIEEIVVGRFKITKTN